MKTMQERHDEVMRRSRARIAKRKKAVTAACTLGALAVCIGAGTVLLSHGTSNFELTSKPIVETEATDIVYGNGSLRGETDIEVNGDSACIQYTADEIVRVECVDDKFARTWIGEGCDKVMTALETALDASNEKPENTAEFTDSNGDATVTITTASSARITVTYGDGSTREWRLANDCLLDTKSHRFYFPSEEALTALKDALGL